MKRILLSGACGLLLTLALPAADRTFTVVTNAALINHWPADDGLMGTADDAISGSLSAFAQSSPNQYGTYSYIATSFGLSNLPDPFLFGIYDAVTFVLGTVTIDPNSFLTNDIPLIKDLHFSGTELFPGHGPYTVKLTHPQGGFYTHKGSLFSFSSHFDFQGNFVAGPASATNAVANGLALLLEAKDFTSPDLTGLPDDLAAYVTTVAAPLAKSLGASGLLCGRMNLQTGASIPGSTGSFPALVGYAVVVAMEFSSAAAPLQITRIQVTPSGVRLQWGSLTGKTYAVEATGSLGSPFTTLADGLQQTEYLDTLANAGNTRFYRLTSR